MQGDLIIINKKYFELSYDEKNELLEMVFDVLKKDLDEHRERISKPFDQLKWDMRGVADDIN